MKKILMTSGAVVLISIVGLNGCKKGDEPAEVLNVKAITKTIKTPRQECHDEVVTHREQPSDDRQITGGAVGAVVGGLIGSQVGGGSGKKVATAAGAAAGIFAGRKVQENMQANDTYTTTEQRCETVYDSSKKIVGYNVEYKLEDVTNTIRMDYHPGKTIAVKDGQLVLSK
jgi:uncharacterized protein YcfJ